MAKGRRSQPKKSRSTSPQKQAEAAVVVVPSKPASPRLGQIVVTALTLTAIAVVAWATRFGSENQSQNQSSTTREKTTSLSSLSANDLETLLNLPAAMPENSITSIDDEAWTVRIEGAVNELKMQLPNDAQVEHLAGLIQLKLKRTQLAEPSLRRAVELAGDNPEMRLDLADVLSQLGRDDEALQVLMGPVKQPLSTQYQTKLGDCHLRLGQLDEALVAYTAVTQTDPQPAEGWIKLGKTQLQKHLTADSERSARRAIKLAPENTEAWTLLGRALALLKRPDESKAAMSRASNLNQQQAERATQTFEVARAQSMSKVYGSACRSLAILYESKGNPTKAANMYQQSLQADPEDWVALGKWAALLRKLGEFEQSAQLHKRLIRQQPLEIAHYQNLANLSMELNRPRDAEAALRLACLRLPTDGNCHLLLARFLLLLNKPSEAAVEARTAHEILKTDEAAQVLSQTQS